MDSTVILSPTGSVLCMKRIMSSDNAISKSNCPIDAVNQGNWSLSIKLRLECFVIVA